jgi:orotate phosphoribosyltransferase
VVDDTVTSGGSLLQAVDAVREFGCSVVAAATLLDRGGELGARLDKVDVPYVPVLTAADLGFSMGS